MSLCQKVYFSTYGIIGLKHLSKHIKRNNETFQYSMVSIEMVYYNNNIDDEMGWFK